MTRLRNRPSEIRTLVPGRLQMQPVPDPATILQGGDTQPLVGDLVLCRSIDDRLALIESVLPRRSLLSRKAVGRSSDSQLMAANLDLLWIVMPADRPLSDGGLLRYLNLAGSIPVRVAITKCDQISSPSELADLQQRIGRFCASDQIRLLSVHDSASIESMQAEAGNLLPLSDVGPPLPLTGFVGPSGAGKSTLMNALLGNAERLVASISASTHKGRHTTTRRDIVWHPAGYGIMDTPGMRELGQDTLDADGPFAIIAELATRCKYRNCQHDTEAGCAVKSALASGQLEPVLVTSYRALKAETALVDQFRQQRRKAVKDESRAARRSEKEEWHKKISKQIREMPDKRRRE
ncbi:MAG: ribosome small subunit-dependent GTPase A [Leptospiraceae bacterium]|nr:ribosome small subunit-dependent GTPase A [Leptospiraceae bacterium]